MNIRIILVIGASLVATVGLADTNLILNPSFETGDFTDWSFNAFAGVNPIDAHTGTFAVRFASPQVQNPGDISQAFATTPGNSYVLSFWLMNSGDLDGQSPLNEFSAAVGGNSVLDVLNAPDFGYTEFSSSFLATGSSTTVEFAGYDLFPTAFTLDDVSVTLSEAAVPEPSTWAAGLLTAGALLCSIWRRRAGWFRRRAQTC